MTKKILAAVLALCMMLSLMNMTAFAEDPDWVDGGGFGTESSPYIINSYAALDAFADAVVSNGVGSGSDVYVQLGTAFPTDSGPMTKCIGAASGFFKGHFDGNGKTVALSINISTLNVGLFGVIKGGTVKNVTVTGVVQGKTFVGGVVGYAEDATVTSCTNKSIVVGLEQMLGGIVGFGRRVTIDSCRNEAYICGGNKAGGIVGFADTDCTVSNCFSSGEVGGGNDLGGIVGRAEGVNITNGFNEGTVVGAGERIAGIVGYCYDSLVSSCENEGNVSATSGDSGGIAGQAEESALNSCTNSGEVGGPCAVGGIVGFIYDSSADSCTNEGGVIGYECHVGGVTGSAQYASLTSCVNTGDVTGLDTCYDVGGVAGEFFESRMTSCSTSGNISGRYNCWLLFGHNWSPDFSGNTAGGTVTTVDFSDYTKNRNVAYRANGGDNYDFAFYDGISWRQTTCDNGGFSFSTVASEGEAPDQMIDAGFATYGKAVKLTVTYTNTSSGDCTFTPVFQANTMPGSDDRGVCRQTTVKGQTVVQVSGAGLSFIISSDNAGFTAKPCDYSAHSCGEYATALEYPSDENATDTYLVCSWDEVTLETGESVVYTVYFGGLPETDGPSPRSILNTDPITDTPAVLIPDEKVSVSTNDDNPNTGIVGKAWTF